MQDSEKWEIVHAFQRAVREERTGPLTCPTCGDDTPVIFRLGDDDLPVLHCLVCKTKTHPWIDLYDYMKMVS